MIRDVTSQIDDQIGRRLRTVRRSKGYTQQQIGAAVGVRFQQIQKYESGANGASASRLWQLATALGTSVDYFFEDLAD